MNKQKWRHCWLIFGEIVDSFPGLAVRDGVYTIISEKSFENSCCFQWVSE